MLLEKGMVDHSCLCRQLRAQPDKGVCKSCTRDIATIRKGMDIAVQYLASLPAPHSDLVKELLRKFATLY